MDHNETGQERTGSAERPQESGAAVPGRGGRMSCQRKTAAVMRLLRGEDLETVSRALGVTAATLTAWRDAFLAAGEAALATRPDSGEALETDRLKAKLGEVLVERDLLHEKIAILELSIRFAARSLWPAGGRGDEHLGLLHYQPPLRPRRRLPGLAHAARRRLSPPRPDADSGANPSWPDRPDARRRPAHGHSRRPHRKPLFTAKVIGRSGPGYASAVCEPPAGACCG